LYLSISKAIKQIVVIIEAYNFCQIRTKFYPTSSCQGSLHMQRILLGINKVDSDASSQLMIIYSAFVTYLRKNGNTLKRYFSSLQTSRKPLIKLGGEVLYNIFIEFGILTQLVQQKKKCVNVTYSRVRVGKNLSYMFPSRNGLKKGGALSPTFFSFDLEYAIRRIQVNQEGWKLNDAHQLLVYADDVNILGGSVHTIKKNAEALVVASKEIGLEVNADKTTYMVISRDQDGGQSHIIKTDNSSFARRVEEFKYLGTTLTKNLNSIQEEIKSRL